MGGRLENGCLALGRVMLAACFIPSGLAKLSNIPGFALSWAGAGLPYANVLATACVVANVFGPLALVAGFAPRLTASALIAVTGVTAVLLHRFWEAAGAVRVAEQAAFLNHLGIIAGLLLYLVSGPGAWSWQGFWRSRREEAPTKASPKAGPRKRELAIAKGPAKEPTKPRQPRMPRAA